MTINDVPSAYLTIPVQLTTRSMANNSTASAGDLTGAALVIMTNTGGTPGTYTTRTCAQMIADAQLYVGQTWLLILANNQGTGTLTFTAGSQVTVGGTATVAANTARLFTVSVASLTSIVFTGLAIGFTSNA